MIQGNKVPTKRFVSIKDAPICVYLFVCTGSYYRLALQKVENRVRILSDLRELASAESLDTFTLIYTNILEHQPDCPVSAKSSFRCIFGLF